MIFQLGISFVAICLAIQDFKYRKVNLFLLVLFGLLCLIKFSNSSLFWLEMILNMTYLTILLSVSFLLIKCKAKVEIKNAIGAGDVIFLYFTGLLFYFDHFLIWVVIALITSLGLHILIVNILKPKEKSIPLLGYMTLTLIPALLLQ